jgi:hypothetical protein
MLYYEDDKYSVYKYTAEKETQPRHLTTITKSDFIERVKRKTNETGNVGINRIQNSGITETGNILINYDYYFRSEEHSTIFK